jgi:hypothetical protein
LKTHADDVREVRALTMPNLSRTVTVAARGGHSEVVAKLLHFASQHNVPWTDVIDYDAIEATIQRGHAEIFKHLATFAPEIVLYDLRHYGRPLDKAISKRHVALTAVILELGGGRDYGAPPWMSPHIFGGRLCKAVNEKYDYKTFSDLLLAHGYTVAGSGALHIAAERGHLKAMQYLIDRGADIDEILPAANLPYQQLLYSTWTPMHFAARKGMIDAVHFLESKGARTDVVDRNGKTALQLLSEHDASSDAEPRHDYAIA